MIPSLYSKKKKSLMLALFRHIMEFLSRSNFITRNDVQRPDNYSVLVSRNKNFYDYTFG